MMHRFKDIKQLITHTVLCFIQHAFWHEKWPKSHSFRVCSHYIPPQGTSKFKLSDTLQNHMSTYMYVMSHNTYWRWRDNGNRLGRLWNRLLPNRAKTADSRAHLFAVRSLALGTLFRRHLLALICQLASNAGGNGVMETLHIVFLPGCPRCNNSGHAGREPGGI